MRTVFIKHFVNNEWLLLLWPKIPSIVLSQKGIEPSDKMLVNLFVYLFNTKCRIANTVQSDIAIIQLATCNTATVRLFVDYKLKCVLVRVVFNPISSSSSIRWVNCENSELLTNSGCTPLQLGLATTSYIIFYLCTIYNIVFISSIFNYL